MNDSCAAAGVLVAEASLEHIGDGLEAAVRVVRESCWWAHRELIQQQKGVQATQLPKGGGSSGGGVVVMAGFFFFLSFYGDGVVMFVW